MSFQSDEMRFSESELLLKIRKLEKENKILKDCLTKAGISYMDLLSGEMTDETEKIEAYDPDQGARINKIDVTDEIATAFFMKFCRGRKDVYVLRHTSRSGHTGYYTQCQNRWDSSCHINKRDNVRCKDCEIQSFRPLTLSVIKAHLLGKDPIGNDVVGIYPMLEGNLCQFLVFDFDNHSQKGQQNDYANNDNVWKKEVDTLRTICRNLGIEAVVERSRSGMGAHVWIFFKEPVPAKLARRFGFALLEKGAQSVDLKSFRYYDRMIPAQDRLPKNGLGNVIALPLQGLALKEGNSVFVDENWNAYRDQLKVLSGIKRLSLSDIEDFLKKWQKADTENDINDDVEPWDIKENFDPKNVSGIVDIVLSKNIYVDKSKMTNGMKYQIRKLAAFSNSQYFRNLAMDLINYDEPRYIYLGEDEGKYIVLPRGLKEKLLKKFDDAKITYTLDDRREEGRKINVSFKGELRGSQKEAADAIVKEDTGILHAATAFGKTVVCCEMIARHKVNTLILVDKTDLMNQWLERLDEFLDIQEELPQYTTKTGRIKTRKSLIGNLQGSHDTMTGIVDVAMIRSLKKSDEFHPLLHSYGQIIFDECHHAASDTAIEVLREVPAKYVYGVTATPKRGDGKEKINEFLLEPVRYRFTSKDRAKEQNIDHFVYPRFTRTVSPHHLLKTPYGNDAFDLIRNNDVRDDQIVNDVIQCVKLGRSPVILTKFVDHAEKLYEKLKDKADKVILLTGSSGSRKRTEQIKELRSVVPSASLILVGTGSLLGEGFDFPRLDTLFMATPVSGENVVEQYVGRLNCDYEIKHNVIVYDYVDSHVPKFDKMYSARLRAYKKIGYEICSGIHGEKQKANAIYDMDNYSSVFWKDISQAESEVIISSPRLNTEKVLRLISVLDKPLENGVKAVVITWHLDAYMYGRDDVRMELMERLRLAGIKVHLVEKSCEHYAVIDRKTVWYGSMNLLSKEDVEDNLMRVQSEEIATELMEMTFGNEWLMW